MAEIEALDMVRRIRDAQYEQKKDMNREELRGYFRKEAARIDSQAQRLLREQTKKKEVVYQEVENAKRGNSRNT